ncbi:MAG: hypothetical protein JW902_18235 [Syntrophaceae bacterium]|nr:hypothetical protein [Syntrophaceae bacterium]
MTMHTRIGITRYVGKQIRLRIRGIGGSSIGLSRVHAVIGGVGWVAAEDVFQKVAA